MLRSHVANIYLLLI